MSTEPLLGEWRGIGLVEALRQGSVSSVALTESYLERIERHDPSLHAYVTVAADDARQQAQRADDALARGRVLGPLHGLPLALKDNIDTAGLRTTRGSRFFAESVPEDDAEVTGRLRAAGAVILGKTQLHEFAYGATTQNPHFGDCRNPWDTARIPGGSSGGSGTAVAAELCAAALGTDTGGSVRIPAALNGVAGLRPTLGRVSNHGVFRITWTLDTVGPLACSVVDVAHVSRALSGFDPRDPLSVEQPENESPAELDTDADGIVIGLLGGFYSEDVDPGVAAAVGAAADDLERLGVRIEDIEVPGARAAHDASTLIARAEAFAIHSERLELKPEMFGEDVRRRLELGRPVTGSEYAEAREVGRCWLRELQEVFRHVDALLTPTVAVVAPPAAGVETVEATRVLARLTYGWSFAGLPSLSVPCGFSDGLPVGLQLAGRPWEEATLLRLGASFQRATDWHLQAPSL